MHTEYLLSGRRYLRNSSCYLLTVINFKNEFIFRHAVMFNFGYFPDYVMFVIHGVVRIAGSIRL